MKEHFRELKRVKQALSPLECDALLKKAVRGTLALNGDDGYPYVLPIDYYYDSESKRLYFHSGKTGYKVDCIERSPKASFTVMDQGERHEGEWWLTVKSVIAFGEVESITDPEIISDISRKLSLRFTTDREYIEREIEKYLPATLLLAFRIEHITGKFVREK